MFTDMLDNDRLLYLNIVDSKVLAFNSHQPHKNMPGHEHYLGEMLLSPKDLKISPPYGNIE